MAKVEYADGTCGFGTLFDMNVPHLIENIFFSLDYASLKTCHRVCNQWKELIQSEAFQVKARSQFRVEIKEDEDNLCNASDEGNVEEVKRIISSGIMNINCCAGGSGRHKILKFTPLCYASHNGNVDVVQILLDGGADPDKGSQDGRSPLFSATMGGFYGWVPLHWAANLGNAAVIRALLGAGADPNKRDEMGRTPLHLAAQIGRGDLVKIILDAPKSQTSREELRHLMLAQTMELRHGTNTWRWSICSGMQDYLTSMN